jgi:hypothetical protein
VTDLADRMLTVHVAPDVASQPLQPVKRESRSGVAVKVTVVPLTKLAEQALPQLIPDGLDVTVPLPRPDLLTVSVNRSRVNVALTVLAALIVTLQVAPEAASHPVHPVKREPDAETAVNVTCMPLPKEAEHVVPQLIPAGLDVTLPLPSPCLSTVRLKPSSANVACTDRVAVMLTLQLAPETASHPVHPVKIDPGAETAVSVTCVPLT